MYNRFYKKYLLIKLLHKAEERMCATVLSEGVIIRVGILLSKQYTCENKIDKDQAFAHHTNQKYLENDV
jgi:hypothetical protein